MSKEQSRDTMLILLCRVLVCFTFLGRAWQHLRWDAPVRALVWNQSILEPVISFLGIPWKEWVSNLSVDAGIQNSIRAMGVFYLICALVSLSVSAKAIIRQRFLMAGSAMLFGLSVLYFMDQYYRIGQLIEYSLQWSAPLFLVAALRGGLHHARFALGLKIAIALTFVGHGLYAAGIYPMPGPFVSMLMNGLGLGEDLARTVLMVAGYADFIAAFMLFVPACQKPAIVYVAVWGTATALARLISNADAGSTLVWLDAWGYQAAFRLVHGGMPLLLWFLVEQSRSAAGSSVRDSGHQTLPQPA